MVARGYDKKKIFVNNLLLWHKESNRNHLFWRITKNPFHILISEIMLQKTTVKQVENLIHDFIKKNNLTYEFVEAGGNIARYYQVRAAPTSVLLDREGKTVIRREGFRSGDEKTYAEEIKKLLSESDSSAP